MQNIAIGKNNHNTDLLCIMVACIIKTIGKLAIHNNAKQNKKTIEKTIYAK